MKTFLLATIASLSSLFAVAADACPELNGNYSCGIGIPFLTMQVNATTLRQGSTVTYTILGYQVVADGHEQRPSHDFVLRGNTFRNVVYTGQCVGKALSFRARGTNATKGGEGDVTGVMEQTPRGQISIRIQGRYNGRNIKYAATCTPRR